MGLPDDENETLWQATERLATDPKSRSSIAGALAAARENTRGVRHVVPVEFWEHINATWSALPLQWEATRRAGPAPYLSFVKTQVAGITGLADTMMSRDQTWLFFTLGRCLETTDVVARQLATVEFDQVFDSGLVMLLRSCGGYEPYLRLSQGVVEPGRVLDFLLRDRLFPRSAYASLTLAEECLDKINSGRHGHVGGRPRSGRAGPGRARVLLAGLAVARARDPAGAAAGLHLLGLRRRDAALLRPGPAHAVAPRGWGRMTRADGWRLHVAHETRFDYNAPARASYNELRLTPRTERRQTALETKVVTVPPAPQYSYVDYWGTQVVAFNVDRGHEMLSITGTGADRHPTAGGARGRIVGGGGRRLAHHGRPPLAQALHRARAPSWRSWPQSLRAARPLETARRIMERTHDSLRYVRGVTSVHTSAYEAFVDGAGVCQDFAHLALAMTKSVGLPSRYVSGYFHPEADAVIGEEIVGESHAWVEVWTGSWWGYDPTNDCPVGERHVAIGRGRDYSDVPPVKGIYAGNAEHTMKRRVHITRTH